MEYNFNDIEKIMSFKTWSDRQKMDELFRIDTNMYTNLGSDSTRKDKDDIKKMSRTIYRAIKSLDKAIGNQLLSEL